MPKQSYEIDEAVLIASGNFEMKKLFKSPKLRGSFYISMVNSNNNARSLVNNNDKEETKCRLKVSVILVLDENEVSRINSSMAFSEMSDRLNTSEKNDNNYLEKIKA